MLHQQNASVVVLHEVCLLKAKTCLTGTKTSLHLSWIYLILCLFLLSWNVRELGGSNKKRLVKGWTSKLHLHVVCFCWKRKKRVLWWLKTKILIISNENLLMVLGFLGCYHVVHTISYACKPMYRFKWFYNINLPNKWYQNR